MEFVTQSSKDKAYKILVEEYDNKIVEQKKYIEELEIKWCKLSMDMDLKELKKIKIEELEKEELNKLGQNIIDEQSLLVKMEQEKPCLNQIKSIWKITEDEKNKFKFR